MARYKKITVAMWGDLRFKALSPIPACGQGLWLYLLTGRETIKIPGLIPSGRAALAEALRWKPEGFAKAFSEIQVQGLAAADWDAPLVWIPNAIRHNAPESANVVKGWRSEWNEIPECALKHQAWRALGAFMEGYGKGYMDAFAEACSEPEWREPEGASPNQEQEQEQEQENTLRLVSEPRADPRYRPITDTLFRVFAESRPGSKPTFAKRQGKRLKDFLADHADVTVPEVEARWRRCLALGNRYPGTARAELFLDRWDEYATPAANCSGMKRAVGSVGDFSKPESNEF
jgi:hypothetical protein